MAGPSSPSLVASAVLMLAGWVVWAVHLGFVYAIVALACALGAGEADGAAIPWIVGALTVAALLAAGGALVRAAQAYRVTPDSQPTRSFMLFLAIAANGLALVAIAWDALPAVLVPACH